MADPLASAQLGAPGAEVIAHLDDLDNARRIMEYRFMCACLPTMTEEDCESNHPVIEEFVLENVADRMTKPSENA